MFLVKIPNCFKTVDRSKKPVTLHVDLDHSFLDWWDTGETIITYQFSGGAFSDRYVLPVCFNRIKSIEELKIKCDMKGYYYVSNQGEIHRS